MAQHIYPHIGTSCKRRQSWRLWPLQLPQPPSRSSEGSSHTGTQSQPDLRKHSTQKREVCVALARSLRTPLLLVRCMCRPTSQPTAPALCWNARFSRSSTSRVLLLLTRHVGPRNKQPGRGGLLWARSKQPGCHTESSQEGSAGRRAQGSVATHSSSACNTGHTPRCRHRHTLDNTCFTSSHGRLCSFPRQCHLLPSICTPADAAAVPLRLS